MLRLLPALLLAFLVLCSPASAAARCPTTTITIGTKQAPRACLPKRPPVASPQALKPFAKHPQGKKPSKRLEALASRELRARAAQASAPAGVEITVTPSEGGGIAEARTKSGESVKLGAEKHDEVARCPKADGVVPAKYDQTMTFGFATAEHGKRTWTTVTLRYEATWTGHVGVGGKAETFDLALRGELTIKSGVEIAATGKVLKRIPTRTYRTALTKIAIPVGVDPVSLLREFTVRGPKGTRGNAEDLKAAGTLLGFAVMPLSEIKDELKQGDVRWYDQHDCAQRDYTWTPEKVVKSGRADWNLWVMAEDGTRVADARWSMSSACGAITATSASGPTAQFGVVDEAGAWGPPSSGACMAVEVTSPAGRARPIFHSIPPLEAKRYRYAISIDFRKSMGPGVAETTATGAGTVTVGPGEGLVEGSGSFSGSEWDSGVLNTCGQDMLRTRTFSSPVAVGAEIQGEQVTIAFTAIERPFDAAWIVTVPVTGGEQRFSSRQPFCGTPELAVRTATVKVAATPVS